MKLHDHFISKRGTNLEENKIRLLEKSMIGRLVIAKKINLLKIIPDRSLIIHG